jgi:hypothetical protein
MLAILARQLVLQQAIHGRVLDDQIIQRAPAEQGYRCAALKVAIDYDDAFSQEVTEPLGNRNRDGRLAGASLKIDRRHDALGQFNLGHEAVPVAFAPAAAPSRKEQTALDLELHEANASSPEPPSDEQLGRKPTEPRGAARAVGSRLLAPAGACERCAHLCFSVFNSC